MSFGLLHVASVQLDKLAGVFSHIDVNPIIWLHKLGMKCLTIAGNLISKIGVLLISIGVADAACQAAYNASTPIGMALNWVKPILLAIIGVLAMAGFFLGFYVPFYPTLLYTFGVLGWILLVIEAMVAAPLVMLGLTHPEGHDFLGRAEQALMLLLQVFVKPTALVIGFLAASIVAVVSLQLVAHVYQGFIGSIFLSNGAHPLSWLHQAWNWTGNHRTIFGKWEHHAAGNAWHWVAAGNAGHWVHNAAASTAGRFVPGSAAASAAASYASKTASSIYSFFSSSSGTHSGLVGSINMATDNIVHNNDDHFLNILIMPGLVLMFCAFVYVAVTKSFSLIYALSDNLLRWIGGPVGQDDSARLAEKVQGIASSGQKVVSPVLEGQMGAYSGLGQMAGGNNSKKK